MTIHRSDIQINSITPQNVSFLAHGSFGTVFLIKGVSIPTVIKIGIIPLREVKRQKKMAERGIALLVLDYTPTFHLPILAFESVVREALLTRRLEMAPTGEDTEKHYVAFAAWKIMKHVEICGQYQTAAMIMPRAHPIPEARKPEATDFIQQNAKHLGNALVELDPMKHVMEFNRRLVLIDLADKAELGIGATNKNFELALALRNERQSRRQSV